MCISQSSRLDYVALKIISGINDYTKKLFKRLVTNILDLTRSNKVRVFVAIAVLPGINTNHESKL